GRRKRRRRRQQRSGGGAAKQRKEMRDMTADDYVLKQGRFRQDIVHATKEQNFMQGIKAEDLAMIKKLGGSLKEISNQANELKLTVTNVSVSDKITPDDKNFATRNSDQRERDREKPGSGIKI